MHLAMGEWIGLSEREVDKNFKAEETVYSGALSQWPLDFWFEISSTFLAISIQHTTRLIKY